jgi:hypothetical protein
MKINNVATALCVLLLKSTAVRAAWYTTTFTFHKGTCSFSLPLTLGDDGSGDRVGPKDIDPEPPSGVQTCARWGQDDGIRSVVIDRSGVDLGNTDYCIYGYEALDCGPLRAVAKTWPGPDDKGEPAGSPRLTQRIR